MLQNMPQEECSSTPAIDLNPENYVNDPNIELQWAQKAYQHAEVYFNLLRSVDTSHLKLTRLDDIIYEEFRAAFKDLNVENIDVNSLKSDTAKEAWRAFCENYREKVEDYNMATLLRLDSALDYTEENTTIAPRIQFYAIEIARNREGHNAKIKQQAQLNK